MWHSTYTHIIQGNFLFLVVRNQIDTLTPCLSFDYNLCRKYPNGSCKLILDIHVLKTFQWCKKIFNPMSFDSSNYSLKIWESKGTPTPKVRIHLGVCELIPSHSLTPWNCECDSWVAFLASTFPCPCLGHEPKVKVMTLLMDKRNSHGQNDGNHFLCRMKIL